MTVWMVIYVLCHPGVVYCENYSGMTFATFYECREYRKQARLDFRRWYVPGLVDHALIECVPIDYDENGVRVRWGELADVGE